MLQAKGASLGVHVRTWKTNRRCAPSFCKSCPSTAARMHTYGMLPPAGALICCWDLQYERAWGMAARNLRIGWVVSTVQDEQDERGVGAPRPKRARSCSPPARLSCEQSVAMVRTAQDKPLRKVAWLVQQIDSVPARFALVLSSCWALLLVVFTATDHLCFIRAGSAFVGPFLG